MSTDYRPTIAFEVHLQLDTASKAYCGCAVVFGAEPNTVVCPVCTGQPGALPVPNRGVFEKAVRVALALGCEISENTHFDRKNYFYPDLPKGYQISQHPVPVGWGGEFRFPLERYGEWADTVVKISRVHLEEDTAKAVHFSKGGTLIDFNRSGVPLMEIVTEPCIPSPEVAHAYLTALKETLEYLDVSSCSMEEGSLRVDTNISAAPADSKKLGTKVEVKNLNSFKAVKAALEYEFERQTGILASGGKVIQETRHWDDREGTTLPGRVKEEAMDYRYFPEPDIPPLAIPREWVEEIRAGLPELPQRARERLHAAGLSGYDAWVLVAERDRLRYFEAVVGAGAPFKSAANWVNGDLAALVKEENRGFGDCPLTPVRLAELIDLVESGKLSGKAAKEVLERAYRDEGSPVELLEKHGLGQISDEGSIEEAVRRVIAEHPTEREAYLAGKTQLQKFFVGQVMKATRGKADPGLVNELVERLLNEPG
ncbi:MAG: Asp-tRNA(Asn)/Glu-tRNA(Gln) amidotransferase subunit GatB [bacterium]|nr:Asp-tRNA(Asn)/Glu-tRNA(Gln) amidotransferase subunit GatB [bacterium]